MVKGVSEGLVELEDIFSGILPYVFACLLMLVMLCVFPGIALYLPQAMSR